MRRLTTPHLVLAGLAVLAVGVGALDRYDWPDDHPDRVDIVYWEKWSGFEFEAIENAVKAYNEGQGEKDGIFVHLINTSEVNNKTMLFTAGGQPPDLAGNWAIYVAPFAEKDSLTPLDEFIAREEDPKVNLDALVPGYVETCRYGDRLWALPIVPATTALFYNRRLFREAGLNPERPPRTIQELDDYARKLDKRDADGNLVQMGFHHKEPGWWSWSWGYYFGGRITDGKGTVLPEPEPWIESLRWAKRYVDHYGTNELGSVKSGFGEFQSPQNAFVSERVAMVIQGVWMPNFISRYNRGLEYDVAPFPAVDGVAPPVTQVETDVITMPKGCRHPKEAWTFMRWLTFGEGARILCSGQGKHTCLRTLPADYVKENRNPHVAFFHGLAESPRAYIVGRFPIMEEFRREMNNAFDEVWQDRKTPEKAIETAKTRLQRSLDRVIARTGEIPPAQ